MTGQSGRSYSGLAAAEPEAVGQGRTAERPTARPMEEAPSLEEVERRHLNDSFWGVT